MLIYCCACNGPVNANLITGKQAYPHRPDLADLLFWQCPTCKNFVGTHRHSTTLAPLGFIAPPELKRARLALHGILDPVWKSGRIRRAKLYKEISEYLGYEYHTANTMSMEEINKVKDYLLKKYGGIK